MKNNRPQIYVHYGMQRRRGVGASGTAPSQGWERSAESCGFGVYFRRRAAETPWPLAETRVWEAFVSIGTKVTGIGF